TCYCDEYLLTCCYDLLWCFLIIFLSSCLVCFLFLMILLPPIFTLFPYTTLFRSYGEQWIKFMKDGVNALFTINTLSLHDALPIRSEERFSRNAETDLVCRLLLEKKKQKKKAVQCNINVV